MSHRLQLHFEVRFLHARIKLQSFVVSYIFRDEVVEPRSSQGYDRSYSGTFRHDEIPSSTSSSSGHTIIQLLFAPVCAREVSNTIMALFIVRS